MKTNNEPRPFFLFWCTDEDHAEDWFVVARSCREARGYYADYEGMSVRRVRAERIRPLPPRFQGLKEATHPNRTMLRACGAIFTDDSHQRVVQIGDRTFTEGGLELFLATLSDEDFEAAGMGRPNGTKPIDFGKMA